MRHRRRRRTCVSQEQQTGSWHHRCDQWMMLSADPSQCPTVHWTHTHHYDSCLLTRLNVPQCTEHTHTHTPLWFMSADPSQCPTVHWTHTHTHHYDSCLLTRLNVPQCTEHTHTHHYDSCLLTRLNVPQCTEHTHNYDNNTQQHDYHCMGIIQVNLR